MDVSVRVIKEPRGFMRIIQCIMAILAFSTTAGFSTECEFKVLCESNEDVLVDYDFGYPFSEVELMVPGYCDERNGEPHTLLKLPFDYSSAAEFYVATGVMSFLYSIIILIVYIFFHQSYANNTKVPVLDLGISSLLAIFWMAGSSAWAEGVRSLKFYLNPDTVAGMLYICQTKNDKHSHGCLTTEDGSYGVLDASLVLGFANFLLWTFGLWFVYKETVYHTPVVTAEPSQNQIKSPARV